MAVSGVSTGSIDINTIVDAYSARYTAQNITPLTTKQTKLQSEYSALGALSSLINTLGSKVIPLKTGTAFLALNASSSNEAVFTAAADSTAVANSYNITVTTLAQQHKVASAQFTNTGTDIVTAEGAGAKTFQVTINGVSTNINVTLTAGDSNQTVLTNIAGAINTAGIGATATISNETGSSSRLVLTSNSSGLANAITIQDTAGTLMQNAQVINGAGTLLNQLQAADDARFTMDSLSYQRSSNSVSDAITGVTMQLKTLGAATLKVSADTETITQSIQDFIDAYNAVIDNVHTTTSYNVDTKESGVLLHYSVARNMGSQLRSMVSAPVAGLPAAYNSLAQIGIDTDKTGKLSIVDSTKLNNALNSSLSSVAAIFNDPADGVVVRLKKYTDNATSLSGALTTAINNDNSQLQSLSYLLTQRQRALEDYAYKLNVQYSALQTLLTNNQTLLNSLSSFSLMPSV